MAADPFSVARPKSAEPTRPIPGYLWSRDSKYILYVQDVGGDENFNVYAHRSDTRGRSEDRRAANARSDRPEGCADLIFRAQVEAGHSLHRSERR
jgi:hypothetical protein